MKKFALASLSVVLSLLLVELVLAEEGEGALQKVKESNARTGRLGRGEKKLELLKNVMKKTGASSRELKKEIGADLELVAKESALIAELAECIQKKFRSDKKFCANIQMLKASAERIQKAAKAGNGEKVKAEFKNLGASCAECHKKYKKVGRKKAAGK